MAKSKFKKGDKVKVGVAEPTFGWGPVKPEEVGVIVNIPSPNYFTVAFPSHSLWGGTTEDLVKVDDIPDEILHQAIV